MTTRAKVLTFDIERRPMLAWEWSKNPSFTPRERVEIPSSTISWAAKWYGEKATIFDRIDSGNTKFLQPAETPGYREMLTHLRDLLDEADVVCGYNSQRFDEAKVRGEFTSLGIRQPSPFSTVDVFKTTKRMGWDYASLDQTLAALGLGSKLAHQGFTMWTDCLSGDTKAWRTMERYNRQDVVQTERAMDALRPQLVGHPNLNLWSGFDEQGNPVEVCANCGKSLLRVVEGKAATTALTAYALVECDPSKGGCGAYLRRNYVKARTTLRSVR